MFNIVCENCGKRMKVPPSAIGKQGKCPRCGNAVSIPPQLPTGDAHEPPAIPPEVPAVVSAGDVEEECGVVTAAADSGEVAVERRRPVNAGSILAWIIAASALVMACSSIVLVVVVVQATSRLASPVQVLLADTSQPLRTVITNRPQVDVARMPEVAVDWPITGIEVDWPSSGVAVDWPESALRAVVVNRPQVDIADMPSVDVNWPVGGVKVDWPISVPVHVTP